MRGALEGFLDCRMNYVFNEVKDKRKEVRELEEEFDEKARSGEITEETLNKITELTGYFGQEGYKIGLKDGFDLPDRFRGILEEK